MNTTFFQKASDGSRALGWKDIFSDVTKKHRKNQRTSLLTKGTGKNIPAPNRMLTEWQKPWFFARVLLAGLILSVVIGVSCCIFAGYAMLLMLCLLPAFVVPLSVMFFYWEMNIPGDISIYEMLLLVLLGGILSLTVTGIVRTIFPEIGEIAFLAGPFPEELAKCLIVTILLFRKKYTYGLQGIVVGGAVGVGFAAIETAGYAFNMYDLSNMQNAPYSIMLTAMINVLVKRGVLAIGGHVVWAALYGGALALIKGKGKMGPKCFMDSMFWMTFTAAFLLHTAWNFDVAYLQGVLPYSVVLNLYNFERGIITGWIKYIVLTVLAWILLFHIMKKSIRQMVRVDQMYKEASEERKKRFTLYMQKRQESAGNKANTKPSTFPVAEVYCVSGALKGKQYTLMSEGHLLFGRNPEKCNVIFPSGTKGVSNVHCELRYRNGQIHLTDLNSSYGTFLGNGRKTVPQQASVLKDQETFYLATEGNRFFVSVK